MMTKKDKQVIAFIKSLTEDDISWVCPQNNIQNIIPQNDDECGIENSIEYDYLEELIDDIVSQFEKIKKCYDNIPEKMDDTPVTTPGPVPICKKDIISKLINLGNEIDYIARQCDPYCEEDNEMQTITTIIPGDITSF